MEKLQNPLQCKIAGINFENPLILASGILGVVPGSMLRLTQSGIGGITSKSVGPRPRFGYNNPSIIEIDEGTFLNSVGLANPGIEIFKEEIKEYKHSTQVPLIVSVFGDGPEGFAHVAKQAEAAGCDAIEINISCPHAEVASIALSPELTKDFTQAVKKAVKIPVFAKLTPNVANMVPIAQAAEQGGADALVMINTLRGLAIDIETGRPILSHGIGGLSGRAVRPIGVRFVYEVFPHVHIPIIGCGGVSSWEDVLEYVYAGACAVQIGSVLSQGEAIIQTIIKDLTTFLQKHHITSIQALQGKAHTFSKELEVNPTECRH